MKLIVNGDLHIVGDGDSNIAISVSDNVFTSDSDTQFDILNQKHSIVDVVAYSDVAIDYLSLDRPKLDLSREKISEESFIEYQKQIEPDASEFECFFHYPDEKLFEAGFIKGVEFIKKSLNIK